MQYLLKKEYIKVYVQNDEEETTCVWTKLDKRMHGSFCTKLARESRPTVSNYKDRGPLEGTSYMFAHQHIRKYLTLQGMLWPSSCLIVWSIQFWCRVVSILVSLSLPSTLPTLLMRYQDNWLHLKPLSYLVITPYMTNFRRHSNCQLPTKSPKES